MFKTNDILLHACCATCCAYPLEKLKEQGFNPTVFYYNPNIYPESEFDKRLNELEKYCRKYGIDLIVENSERSAWYDYIRGNENEPEKGLRCNKCFEFRLMRAAEKAVELNINKFTTTLTVSPHKVSKSIFEAGLKAGEKFKIEFIQLDFKKENGFYKTMQIAKQENFYRQNYCGCEFSIRNDK